METARRDKVAQERSNLIINAMKIIAHFIFYACKLLFIKHSVCWSSTKTTEKKTNMPAKRGKAISSKRQHWRANRRPSETITCILSKECYTQMLLLRSFFRWLLESVVSFGTIHTLQRMNNNVYLFWLHFFSLIFSVRIKLVSNLKRLQVNGKHKLTVLRRDTRRPKTTVRHEFSKQMRLW